MQKAIAFTLGNLYITPGVIQTLHRNYTTGAELLMKHLSGDWGDLSEEDKTSNNEALESGGRLLSAYLLKDESKIWIITEAADANGKRISTTILLPEEY